MNSFEKSIHLNGQHMIYATSEFVSWFNPTERPMEAEGREENVMQNPEVLFLHYSFLSLHYICMETSFHIL